MAFQPKLKGTKAKWAEAVVTRIFNKPIPFLPFKCWCRWGFGHHQNKCYGSATEDMAKCQRWMDEFGFIERPPICFCLSFALSSTFLVISTKPLNFFHGSFVGSPSFERLQANSCCWITESCVIFQYKKYTINTSPPSKSSWSMKVEPEIPKVCQFNSEPGALWIKNVESSTQLQAIQVLLLNSFHLGVSPTRSQAKRDDMQHFHSTKLTEKKQNEAES